MCEISNDLEGGITISDLIQIRQSSVWLYEALLAGVYWKRVFRI
jgi:hypothetical protein